MIQVFNYIASVQFPTQKPRCQAQKTLKEPNKETPLSQSGLSNQTFVATITCFTGKFVPYVF